jgi:hypothetical protein
MRAADLEVVGDTPREMPGPGILPNVSDTRGEENSATLDSYVTGPTFRKSSNRGKSAGRHPPIARSPDGRGS